QESRQQAHLAQDRREGRRFGLRTRAVPRDALQRAVAQASRQGRRNSGFSEGERRQAEGEAVAEADCIDERRTSPGGLLERFAERLARAASARFGPGSSGGLSTVAVSERLQPSHYLKRAAVAPEGEFKDTLPCPFDGDG